MRSEESGSYSWPSSSAKAAGNWEDVSRESGSWNVDSHAHQLVLLGRNPQATCNASARSLNQKCKTRGHLTDSLCVADPPQGRHCKLQIFGPSLCGLLRPCSSATYQRCTSVPARSSARPPFLQLSSALRTLLRLLWPGRGLVSERRQRKRRPRLRRKKRAAYINRRVVVR
jgi:hypothetical protein